MGQKRELQLKEGEFKEYLKNKFRTKFSRFSLSDYNNLCAQIDEILNNIDGHIEYQIQRSYEIILENLAGKDVDLYLKVISKIITRGNKGKVVPYNSVSSVLENNIGSTDKLYKIINSKNFTRKQDWLLLFFYNISEKALDKIYVQEFYEFLKDRNYKWFCITNFDSFKKYETYDKEVFFKMLKIITNRTKEKNFKANFIYLLFYLEDKEELWNKFTEENLRLLKKIYFYQTTIEPMDYNEKVFTSLVKRDNNFIIEYLSFKFKGKDFISRHDEHGKFKMLWELNNYEKIITKAIEFCKKKITYPIYGGEYYTVFFKNVPFNDKVENYIINYIKKKENEIKDINIIFDIITSCYPDKRIYFLKYLFEVNNDFKDFEKLFLEKMGWSSESGSFVNVYERCKLFWKEVEDLLFEINKTSFIAYVRQRIESYEYMIKDELRRNLIDEF